MVPVEKSISCVAASAEELYVIVNQPKDQLRVYDTAHWKFQRSLSVPDLQSSAQNDLALNTGLKCLYLSDHDGKCVHRLNLPSEVWKWSVRENPYGISVSQNSNVLVTCRQVRKLQEYTCVGDILRDIDLKITSPWRSVQLSAERFLVVHGYYGDATRGLVIVDTGGRVQRSSQYSGSDRLDLPRHCAVSDNGCVYLVDASSRRVILMSPDLQYVRDITRGCEDLAWWPTRVCLDPTEKRLYVVDSSTESGRVVVYNTAH